MENTTKYFNDFMDRVDEEERIYELDNFRDTMEELVMLFDKLSSHALNLDAGIYETDLRYAMSDDLETFQTRARITIAYIEERKAELAEIEEYEKIND